MRTKQLPNLLSNAVVRCDDVLAALKTCHDEAYDRNRDDILFKLPAVKRAIEENRESLRRLLLMSRREAGDPSNPETTKDPTPVLDGAYPRFEGVDGRLCRYGLSRDGASEWCHNVSRDVYNRVVQVVGSLGKDGRSFTRKDVQSRMGNERQSKTDAAFKFLIHQSLVHEAGYGRYKVADERTYGSRADSVWREVVS